MIRILEPEVQTVKIRVKWSETSVSSSETTGIRRFPLRVMVFTKIIISILNIHALEGYEYSWNDISVKQRPTLQSATT